MTWNTGRKGLQDLNDIITFSDNPQNTKASKSNHTPISVRGGIKFLLGDFEGALQDFGYAYTNKGQHDRSNDLLNRAFVNCMLARHSDAMQDVSSVAEINPNLNDHILKLQTRLQKILYQPPFRRVDHQLTSSTFDPLPQPSDLQQHNFKPVIPDLLTGDAEWQNPKMPESLISPPDSKVRCLEDFSSSLMLQQLEPNSKTANFPPKVRRLWSPSSMVVYPPSSGGTWHECKESKWVAEWKELDKKVDKKVWLGTFDTEEDAARGVDVALKYWVPR